ncbi:MAG TPA: hypothetical protein VK534_00575 [Methylomirabilota bacterium]|nr:hypothetical protein [Methylomirabilota bacterium]
MYNIIVLGLIPGTNIQISLQAFIAMAALFSGGLWIGWIELVRKQSSTSTYRYILPASDVHVRQFLSER